MTDLIQSIREKEKGIDAVPLQLDEYGFGPWSFSKVKLLRSCPFQFYLKYVLKQKMPQAPISVVTEVGKAAHRILELAPGGRPISEIYAKVRQEYIKVLTDEQWKEMVESLEFSIMKFQDRLMAFDRANPIRRYMHELRIGVTKDFEPTGFFADDVYYRGVIDFTAQLENKDALFLDHKTGAPAIIGIKNFKAQLNTYKVLFHHGIEKIEGAQSGIHFIRDAEITLDDYHTSDEIEGKLKREVTSDVIVTIDYLKDLGKFKKTPGQTVCKYCDYAKECKSKLLNPVEKDTERFF